MSRTGDVVPESLHRAVDQAQHTPDVVLTKARFWHRWASLPLNERAGKTAEPAARRFRRELTSSKWASIAKCSPDTALRGHQ